jgi:hypothetical protein
MVSKMPVSSIFAIQIAKAGQLKKPTDYFENLSREESE